MSQTRSEALGAEDSLRFRRIGFFVNPVAGMGGRVALKGTDDVAELARKMGATAVSPARALRFLRALPAELDLEFFTAASPMGEEELETAGLSSAVVFAPPHDETTGADTEHACHAILATGVDLLVFVGGDGTARDVLRVVGTEVPVLGVPAGVKVMSACFARTPEDAAAVLAAPGPLEEREVMDIDEESLRKGRMAFRLAGYVHTPAHAALQPAKGFAPPDHTGKEVAEAVVALLEPGRLSLLGPGATLSLAKRMLGIDGTLLGVDAVRDGELIVRDATERQLLELPLEGAALFVSPIGRQGFLLGRGNQQLSPAVLRRVGVANVQAVATAAKLHGLSGLVVDTGDPDLDRAFPRHVRVLTGGGRFKMVELLPGPEAPDAHGP